MGWARGSKLFSEVISAVRAHAPDEGVRKALYIKLIDAFEDFDWDTQDECVGEDPAYDEALKELHPEWYEEESAANG
jgi:hypothetical protein